MEKCRACKQRYDTEEMYGPTKRGEYICKDCSRDDSLKRRYGITLEQYNGIGDKQGWVCAICGNGEDALRQSTGSGISLSVDHNHATGKVRALLCTKCNQGIGSFDDNSDTLRAAAAYLDSFV